MNTLFLKAEEQPLFESIRSELREGWNVTVEGLVFEDSPFKFRIRLELLRLHDPSLIALRDRVKHMDNPTDIAAALTSIDPALVLHEDLLALFFTLGSGILSQLIVFLLKDVASDKDLANLVALTFIRHEILSSYQPLTA